jgi:hypothetical protein
MQQSPESHTDNIRDYRVASVEQTAVPEGAEGGNWCRYVIENGYASLMGWRRGSLREITQHAIRCVETLNARNDKSPSHGTYRRKQ